MSETAQPPAVTPISTPSETATPTETSSKPAAESAGIPAEAVEEAKQSEDETANGAVTSGDQESLPALPANADELLKEFYSEVRAADRDNEVNRIIGAFRLNAFEQLGVRFDATPEEIRKEYRKLSLLVHPDKCTHPKAKDAFEIVNAANKQLQKEEVRKELIHTLDLARDEVRKERAKAVKHDSAYRLASVIHADGKAGVDADWENSADFHEAWKKKSREMLAQFEWRRRKLTKRLKDEENRIEEGEAETRQQLKAAREHHKNWESSREKRIGTWREFAQKKPKKAKTKAIGGIKPPKLKTEDEDRTYVQRPAGEFSFRPEGKFTAPKPQRE